MEREASSLPNSTLRLSPTRTPPRGSPLSTPQVSPRSSPRVSPRSSPQPSSSPVAKLARKIVSAKRVSGSSTRRLSKTNHDDGDEPSLEEEGSHKNVIKMSFQESSNQVSKKSSQHAPKSHQPLPVPSDWEDETFNNPESSGRKNQSKGTDFESNGGENNRNIGRNGKFIGEDSKNLTSPSKIKRYVVNDDQTGRRKSHHHHSTEEVEVNGQSSERQTTEPSPQQRFEDNTREMTPSHEMSNGSKKYRCQSNQQHQGIHNHFQQNQYQQHQYQNSYQMPPVMTEQQGQFHHLRREYRRQYDYGQQRQQLQQNNQHQQLQHQNHSFHHHRHHQQQLQKHEYHHQHTDQWDAFAGHQQGYNYDPNQQQQYQGQHDQHRLNHSFYDHHLPSYFAANQSQNHYQYPPQSQSPVFQRSPPTSTWAEPLQINFNRTQMSHSPSLLYQRQRIELTSPDPRMAPVPAPAREPSLFGPVLGVPENNAVFPTSPQDDFSDIFQGEHMVNVSVSMAKLPNLGHNLLSESGFDNFYNDEGVSNKGADSAGAAEFDDEIGNNNDKLAYSPEAKTNYSGVAPDLDGREIDTCAGFTPEPPNKHSDSNVASDEMAASFENKSPCDPTNQNSSTLKSSPTPPDSASERRRSKIRRRKLRRGEMPSPSPSPSPSQSRSSTPPPNKGIGTTSIDQSPQRIESHGTQSQSQKQRGKQESEKRSAENSSKSFAHPISQRRHKMANRVASGKVPIPKAFLSTAAANAIECASNTNAEKQDAAKNSKSDSIIGSDDVKRNVMKYDEDSGFQSDKDCDNANIVAGKVCESDAARIFAAFTSPPPPPPFPPPRQLLPTQSTETDIVGGDRADEPDEADHTETDQLQDGFLVNSDVDVAEEPQIELNNTSQANQNSASITKRRRQKMAEKVASGKVPIPKALLDAQLKKSNSNSSLNNLRCNSSSDAEATLTALSSPGAIELYPSNFSSPNPSVLQSCGSKECSTNSSRLSPSFIISSPDVVEIAVGDTCVDTDANDDGRTETANNNFDILHLPLLLSSDFSPRVSINTSDARRQRRHLRKSSPSTAPNMSGKSSMEQSLAKMPPYHDKESTSEGYSFATIDAGIAEENGQNQGNEEKNMNSSFERRDISGPPESLILSERKERVIAYDSRSILEHPPSPVIKDSSSENSKVNAISSFEREKNNIGTELMSINDTFPGEISVNDEDVLFPLIDDTHFPLSNPDDSLEMTAEPSWNPNVFSIMNETLEQSNVSLKKVPAEGEPLLQLNSLSDAERHDTLLDSTFENLEAASSKLILQKERVAMYNGPNRFGIGEDSSVDNENESKESDEVVDDHGEMCDDNFNYANVTEPSASDDEEDENDSSMDEQCVRNDMDDTDNGDVFEFVDFSFGKGSFEDTATAISDTLSSFANVQASRTLRWSRNPDAISDADDESDLYTKSSITGGGGVFGKDFVESQTGTIRQIPSHLNFDPDSTPKIGSIDDSKKYSIEHKTTPTLKFDATNEQEKPKALFKIPPPPPEKFHQWEAVRDSVGFTMSRFLAEGSAPEAVSDDAIDSNSPDSPLTRSHPGLHVDVISPVLHNSPPNYKINLQKSPTKKKPNTLVEELDLSSHRQMAEKIAMASSKAAKKFDEEYASAQINSNKKPHRCDDEGSLEETEIETDKNSFFCAGDSSIRENLSFKKCIPSPSKISSHEKQDESRHSGPMSPSNINESGALELVGGAFSPWKTSDRYDTYSYTSSPRSEFDNVMFAHATAAAIAAIHGHHMKDVSSFSKRGDRSRERTVDEDNGLTTNTEIDLDDLDGPKFGTEAGSNCHDSNQEDNDRGGDEDDAEKGELSGVLLWLFDEVLTTTSSIAKAFSAFDIDTSTAVQADRVLAIAKDNESFNLICQHVSSVVTKRGAEKHSSDPCNTEGIQRDIQANVSSEEISVSTCVSSDFTSVNSSTIASSISGEISTFSHKASLRIFKTKTKAIDPFQIPLSSSSMDNRSRPEVLAANFIGFLQQVSVLADLPSPYGSENPFLQSVVNLTTKRESAKHDRKTMQDIVFSSQDDVVNIFLFLYKASGGADNVKVSGNKLSDIQELFDDEDENLGTDSQRDEPISPKSSKDENSPSQSPDLSQHNENVMTIRRSNKRNNRSQPLQPKVTLTEESLRRSCNRNLIFPKQSPSPFEMAVWNDPSIVLSILSFLGNPVAVCIVKRLNVFCNRVVVENEHVLMRDAVRLGGLNKFVRPAFWLWVALEKCKPENPIHLIASRRGFDPSPCDNAPCHPASRDFIKLKEYGAAGKWQHVIERDVTRSFGNMPPHKTGARYRQDSIVRALVSFGKGETIKRTRSYQAKSMGKLPEESEANQLSHHMNHACDGSSDGSSAESLAPTDTVSDWGGISPVGSIVSEGPSSVDECKSLKVVSYEGGQVLDAGSTLNNSTASKSDVNDPALSGNALTSEMKVDLQNKLRSVLHALAAQHEGVGYCQGMDYVVAHLLRVLQDTILLRAIQGSLPGTTVSDRSKSLMSWRKMPSEQLKSRMNEFNQQSDVVEEIVFRVMDTLFTTYNLQHMYWPELRCLKTCCRVFESLIKKKLPVLADHFEHHDLNVGLFALGWFQTLFLYLPSMPSATVCHIWDIWLVERSFKIFFRVGTAILFLSQPTLLNHDLEGMMTYLNTFPDATLLRRDILIPCALQIKITNRMLVEIEMDVTSFQ
ncbi:hypothetical protein ACHAXS_012377 [Conticribra weissflogii]